MFAGLLVELVLRLREKSRSLQVMHLLRSELLRLTDEFLLATLPAECLAVSPRWYVFGPNLDTYVVVEAADSSMYEDGTTANRKLWEAAKSELPNVALERKLRAASKESHKNAPGRSPAGQVERLTITRKNIEGIYQRYGLHLDPETSALLARLYRGLSTAIYDESLPVEEDNEEIYQSAYVSTLVEAWCAAYQIHSAEIREGRILTVGEFHSRSRSSPAVRAAVTSSAADRRRPP